MVFITTHTQSTFDKVTKVEGHRRLKKLTLTKLTLALLGRHSSFPNIIQLTVHVQALNISIMFIRCLRHGRGGMEAAEDPPPSKTDSRPAGLDS